MIIKIISSDSNQENKIESFYLPARLDLDRSVVQSMEIDPFLSDAVIEEVQQTHLVDPMEMKKYTMLML